MEELHNEDIEALLRLALKKGMTVEEFKKWGIYYSLLYSDVI